jgi:hypothetical protein
MVNRKNLRARAAAAIAVAFIAVVSLGYYYATSRKSPRTLSLDEGIRKDEGLVITFTGTKRLRKVLVDLQFSVNAPAGHVFFLVNVTFENVGKTDLGFARDNLCINPDNYFPDAVLVADGQEFEIMDSAFPIYDIMAGETVDTYVFFEIPENLAPDEVHSSVYEKEREWVLKLSTSK